MSILIIPIIIILFIYLDAKILNEHNPLLYKKILKLNPKIYATLFVFLIFIVLPMYYFRRLKFFHELKLELEINSFQTYLPKKSYYITEFTEIILKWLFIFFEISIIIIFIYFFKLGDFEFFEEFIIISMNIFCGISFIVLMYTTIKKNRNENIFKKLFFNGKEFSKKLIYIPIFLSFFVVPIYSFYISWFIGYNDVSSKDLITNSPFYYILFAVLPFILTAFISEIIFRGYIFSIINEIKGKYVALILISLFSVLINDNLEISLISILMCLFYHLSITLLRSWLNSVIPGIIITCNIIIFECILKPLIF